MPSLSPAAESICRTPSFSLPLHLGHDSLVRIAYLKQTTRAKLLRESPNNSVHSPQQEILVTCAEIYGTLDGMQTPLGAL